ncbi:MAG: cytochrome c oxidase subunit I [Gemmatimonadaceae bacterium]|nr:cytochrome c oxidase subunit I [Gemmatimonadaceae bacterium]
MTTVTPRDKSDAFDRVWSDPRGFIGWLRTINNVPIAHRYMVTGFAFFLFGGIQALLMRIQLGTPENTFLSAERYNQLFTMHGTTMMFLFVIPFIEAIANYMLPLMLGARDLPFPRLTALSYWTYLFGGIFLYSSFVFGAVPDGGWFAYVPLTSKEFSPGLGLDFWDIGLSVAEVAAIGAAAELIVGILRMRAPGMSLSRLPLFAWAMLVTAFMLVLAFTPLIVGTAMLELDRKGLTRFFDVAAGGDPLLWQHIFWAFGHPEVYIMFLPALGIVSHIVQTFSRRPLIGYRAVVGSMIATGAIAFVLWVHHMFAVGMSAMMMNMFTAASMLIAIPSGIQIFSWIATLWLGRPVWKTPLIFVAGFIAIFTLGGITGVMVSVVPFDLQAHDSYFIVAHFHYVLIGGVVFPLFAGLYYWLPKITGRLLSERLGKWNFWLMFVFFNVTFFPMHVAGLLGMPRRVYTYETGLGWDLPNFISTIGAFGFAAGILLFAVNVLWSGRRGAAAGNDPWGGDTLEWSETSPPRAAQFPFIPAVTSRNPLWSGGPREGIDSYAGAMLAVDAAPTRWRGSVCVTMREARPIAVAHFPSASIWPFAMSVAFVLIFAGALVDSGWLALTGIAGTLASLVGWFWPMDSQGIALDEMRGAAGRGELPLAVHGPVSNGWWGTIVLIIVYSIALATLVASYLYLAQRWVEPEVPDLISGILASAVVGSTVLTAVLNWWAARNSRRERLGIRRFGLTVSTGLDLISVACIVLLFAYSGVGLTAAGHAQQSLFYLFLVFSLFAVLTHLAIAGTACLWTWLAPDDERGLAPAKNGALMGYFVAAGWMVTVTMLYVGPRML